MKDSILGIIRHLLTAGGGALVTTGLADDHSLTEAVGALITLIGFGWSVWSKIQARKQAQQAAKAAILAACMIPWLSMQTGCSAVAPGNDPVVVHAERTTQLAYDVFDTFLLWEFQHRQALSQVPEIRQAADFIRLKSPDWLATARSMTRAYKSNRTDGNEANLMTALAVIKTGMAEAERQMSAGVAELTR